MDKKVWCIIGVIVAVLLICFIITKVTEKSYLNNDGEGKVEFGKLSEEAGFGLDIDEGEFPLDIEIKKGEIAIKICRDSNGDETIFETEGIKESQQIVPYIPETGYYYVLITGKNAKGTINYPVSESKNEPIIDGKEIETNPVDEEIVKTVIEENFKKEYGDTVEEVKFNEIKIYTKEEIENDELMQELELGEHDLAFDISYELKIKEGTEDLQQFTAATGEIEGQWIKEKYNCGVARYDEDKDTYSLSDFGTSF